MTTQAGKRQISTFLADKVNYLTIKKEITIGIFPLVSGIDLLFKVLTYLSEGLRPSPMKSWREKCGR